MRKHTKAAMRRHCLHWTYVMWVKSSGTNALRVLSYSFSHLDPRVGLRVPTHERFPKMAFKSWHN